MKSINWDKVLDSLPKALEEDYCPNIIVVEGIWYRVLEDGSYEECKNTHRVIDDDK